MTDSTHSNRLKESTSPYLRQHATNPVDWYPWGEEAFAKAKRENKPILLSIGYSSCHWCHVMAHESFEDTAIAAVMNQHFVNIKLDREERPDIDQIYMEAVQAMGLRGGWPLNVFLTPDQKPFYGGTYFPPANWKKLLTSISEAYKNNYTKLSESADAFASGIQASEFARYQLTQESDLLSAEDFQVAVDSVKKRFDTRWGGMQRAPKFPMPSTWNFFLHIGHSALDDSLKSHTLFTLNQIAAGGIYDQIGGGFSRYSVDAEWHVPHFEKMLYDNGQLMSLYANAYKVDPKPEYLRVLEGTAAWLKREMMNKDGGFYSALDADSEGVEGKFYVWSKTEIDALAGANAELVCSYFDVSEEGNWEETNVLRRLQPDRIMTVEFGEFQSIIEDFKTKALAYREQRVRPGLDDKIISGWNGLMLTGLLDAYQATGNEVFAELAHKNAAFIQSRLIKDGKLIRLYQGNQAAFLEDYAAVIQAFIKYYETFFDEIYLMNAAELTNFVMEDFFDSSENLFFFTGSSSEGLIARKKELFDNVISASNSIMAENLYRLGLMLDHESYKSTAITMVRQVSPLIKSDVEFMANWANVAFMMTNPTPEIILVGSDFYEKAAHLNRLYLPNKIIMGSATESKLPLFAFKTANGDESMIYVCYNKTCKIPVIRVEEAVKQLE